MAFANLFSRLSAEVDVKSPLQPGLAHRSETGNGKRGNARKRKPQGEQMGCLEKRPCNQTQTTRSYEATSFRDDDHTAKHYYMQDSHHNNAGKGGRHNHRGKAGHHNMSPNVHNTRTNNNPNRNKQHEQKKKTEWQHNQHHQKDGWRPAHRGGRHTSRKGRQGREKKKQDSEVKRTRFMSQEFKDQNVLSVDGRLLCKHFLLGRCIKDGDCQLEHIQGYNDLFKEACKFYIQGACFKGESCPYMHNSFPCKFFHRRGKCIQGEDCKFSHEPLNDLTNRLLEEALKRDQELYELAKKAEQESLEQPVNTDESKKIDTDELPDILSQPLRPNFYQHVETNAENQSSSTQSEKTTENIKEDEKPHSADGVQPPTSPSTYSDHKEPVCYSVEAVLGPQLSKPFPRFFTSPRSQESAPQPPSESTPVSANQSLIPYSVEAVLQSFKSVETPTPPPAQTLSYKPKADFAERADSQLNSDIQNNKVWYSVNGRNEGNKPQDKMFKTLPSLQTHTGLVSKACPDLTMDSEDHKTLVLNMQESPKPVHEVKSELHFEKSFFCNSKGDIKESVPLSTENKPSVHCQSVFQVAPDNYKRVFPSASSLSSENPDQMKPNLSALTSDSGASFKPFCPSSGFTKFTSKAAVPTKPVSISVKSNDSADSVSHLAAKQPPESDMHSEETPADCSGKRAHCGRLAGGRKQALRTSFHNLFASPITDSMKPISDSVTTSSSPKGLIQSSGPAQKSARLKSNHLITAVNPDKAPTRSFVSLFEAPLSDAPLPGMSRPNYSKTLSGSQKTVQTVKVVKEISPKPKVENEGSSPERENQIINPACSLVPGSVSEGSSSPSPGIKSQTTTHADHPMPEMSSRKEAPASSILKTLFLHLSPYHQNEEQQDSVQIGVPPGNETTDKMTKGGLEKQQQKSKRKGRRW